MIWYLFIPLLLVGWFLLSFSRHRAHSSPALGVVIGLLDDIGYDLNLVEKMLDHLQPGNPFKIANWKIYRNQLGFLEPELESDIQETFSRLADMKAKGGLVGKGKQAAPWSDEELVTLKSSLTEIGAVLIDWLKETSEPENE